jgi:hypothetical protein
MPRNRRRATKLDKTLCNGSMRAIQYLITCARIDAGLWLLLRMPRHLLVIQL